MKKTITTIALAVAATAGGGMATSAASDAGSITVTDAPADGADKGVIVVTDGVIYDAKAVTSASGDDGTSATPDSDEDGFPNTEELVSGADPDGGADGAETTNGSRLASGNRLNV